MTYFLIIGILFNGVLQERPIDTFRSLKDCKDAAALIIEATPLTARHFSLDCIPRADL